MDATETYHTIISWKEIFTYLLLSLFIIVLAQNTTAESGVSGQTVGAWNGTSTSWTFETGGVTRVNQKFIAPENFTATNMSWYFSQQSATYLASDNATFGVKDCTGVTWNDSTSWIASGEFNLTTFTSTSAGFINRQFNGSSITFTKGREYCAQFQINGEGTTNSSNHVHSRAQHSITTVVDRGHLNHSGQLSSGFTSTGGTNTSNARWQVFFINSTQDRMYIGDPSVAGPVGTSRDKYQAQRFIHNNITMYPEAINVQLSTGSFEIEASISNITEFGTGWDTTGRIFTCNITKTDPVPAAGWYGCTGAKNKRIIPGNVYVLYLKSNWSAGSGALNITTIDMGATYGAWPSNKLPSGSDSVQSTDGVTVLSRSNSSFHLQYYITGSTYTGNTYTIKIVDRKDNSTPVVGANVTWNIGCNDGNTTTTDAAGEAYCMNETYSGDATAWLNDNPNYPYGWIDDDLDDQPIEPNTTGRSSYAYAVLEPSYRLAITGGNPFPLNFSVTGGRDYTCGGGLGCQVWLGSGVNTWVVKKEGFFNRTDTETTNSTNYAIFRGNNFVGNVFLMYRGDRTGTYYSPTCDIGGTAWSSTDYWYYFPNGTSLHHCAASAGQYEENYYNVSYVATPINDSPSLTEYALSLYFLGLNASGTVYWDDDVDGGIDGVRSWTGANYTSLLSTYCSGETDGECLITIEFASATDTNKHYYQFYNDYSTSYNDSIYVYNSTNAYVNLYVTNLQSLALPRTLIRTERLNDSTNSTWELVGQQYTADDGTLKIYYNTTDYLRFTILAEDYQTKIITKPGTQIMNQTVNIVIAPANVERFLNTYINTPTNVWNNDTTMTFYVFSNVYSTIYYNTSCAAALQGFVVGNSGSIVTGTPCTTDFSVLFYNDATGTELIGQQTIIVTVQNESINMAEEAQNIRDNMAATGYDYFPIIILILIIIVSIAADQIFRTESGGSGMNALMFSTVICTFFVTEFIWATIVIGLYVVGRIVLQNWEG